MADITELLESARPQAMQASSGLSGSEGAVVSQLLAGTRRYLSEGKNVVYALGQLSPEGAAEIFDRLGQGEVSLRVGGRHQVDARETGLRGIWRVQQVGQAGDPPAEYLEIGDVPSVVRATDANALCDDLSIGDPPPGAMNVLPVLAELRHRMKTWTEGMPNHVLSFTLLPMNEVDMGYLQQRVGHGPMEAESHGYGRCRIELTGHRHIWSVQFFNVSDKLVLDTLEVGDVPAAMAATDEDLRDSAQRLEEVLSG